MEYCKRCLYPENAKPTILFDDEGVCSGCRYHESRSRVDWKEREKMFAEMLKEYKAKARERNQPYDCIIPVSGGKDSHFQAYLIKNVYGLNPLLVTFNHAYNSIEGTKNLNNITTAFGCDVLRFTANPHSAKKISRHMLKTCGDVTWHYHAGIRTLPFQVAVKYDIPLIIWGEHGFAELTGLVTLDDMVEHTKWSRQEHDMRGFEPDDLIGHEGIAQQDLAPYFYPSDEDIERLDLRGIYLSNFLYWDALTNARKMRDEFGFHFHPGPRERTFNLYAKIEDHCNDVHDYLKYLKFGYGRATDDASMEIRHGRMTREEGIELVRKYDANRPQTLDTYLDFLEITEEEFLASVEDMRDEDIWVKENGVWTAQDSVVNHAGDDGVDAVRPALVDEANRTFGPNNKGYYWPGEPGLAEGGSERETDRRKFIVI